MKLNLEALLANFRAGKGPHVVLCHGDSFRIRSACKAILDVLVPEEKRAFNLEQLNGPSTSWEQVEAALRTPPFFEGCKVVWVENAPFFAPSERRIRGEEAGEALFGLWAEGRREQAGKSVMSLLAQAGWDQPRWENASPATIASQIADVLSQDSNEARNTIEAIVDFCRQRGWEAGPQKTAAADGLMAFLEVGWAPGTTVLVLSAAEVDRRTRLYRRLADMGSVLDLSLDRDNSGRIKPDAIAQFVRERIGEAGKKMEAQAREAILKRAGTELWAIHQEVEKLLLYVGEEPEIKAVHVEAVFRDHSEAWVFDLTDAIGRHDATRALQHLSELLDQGEHPLRILAVVATEVRKLLAARQLIDSELSGRWRKELTYAQFQSRVLKQQEPLITRSAYADYLCFQRAEGFGCEDLLGYLHKIHLTDMRLKSSSGSPRMALERLILEMCTEARSADDAARAHG